jgi:membrane AbrB-like protein
MADGVPEPGSQPPSSRRQAVRRLLDDGLASLARPLGTSPGVLQSWGRSYAIAAVAGVLFLWLALPLPWLLGPLTIALIFSVWGRPLEQPHALVLPVRSLLGVAIGSSFTPDLMDKAGAATVSLLLLIPYTVIITLMGTVLLVRLAGFDRPTAFFSSAPGGLADMMLYAQDAGANIRRVTLIQASRVLVIVFALPFWLQFIGGLPLGGAMPKTLHIWQLTLGDAAVIAFLACAGWRIADRLGLVGGSIVGPMILSALAHGLGLTDAKVPVEIIVLAQVTFGIVIGAQFKGISLSEFVTTLSWGLAFAFLLVIAAGAMAISVAALTGLDPTSLLLSYAPGGQNEMAVMGLILGVDVAIVALHHLLRVLMVVVGAQLVLQANPGWRTGKT